MTTMEERFDEKFTKIKFHITPPIVSGAEIVAKLPGAYDIKSFIKQELKAQREGLVERLEDWKYGHELGKRPVCIECLDRTISFINNL